MPKIKFRTKTYRYYVGIDTGDNTGIACWEKKDNDIYVLETVKIHEAMDIVKELNDRSSGSILVRIEDARLRKWIPRQKDIKTELARREGAGSVKRDASIWEDFLEDLGIDYELVPPKNNKTKVKAEYFKSITGYDKPTNEHSRDACMLVYGI